MKEAATVRLFITHVYADQLGFSVYWNSMSTTMDFMKATYMKEVDRIGRLFFYHENIYRKRSEKTHGIPSSDFPPLNTFKELYSCESRWLKYGADSVYPCHENPFVKKGHLT